MHFLHHFNLACVLSTHSKGPTYMRHPFKSSSVLTGGTGSQNEEPLESKQGKLQHKVQTRAPSKRHLGSTTLLNDRERRAPSLAWHGRCHVKSRALPG